MCALMGSCFQTEIKTYNENDKLVRSITVAMKGTLQEYFPGITYETIHENKGSNNAMIKKYPTILD